VVGQLNSSLWLFLEIIKKYNNVGNHVKGHKEQNPKPNLQPKLFILIKEYVMK
jgi:hypothetical protein